MPLHREPTNTAEALALHLETEYGLQLDPFRHKHLVAELQVFGEMFIADSSPSVLRPGLTELTDEVSRGTEPAATIKHLHHEMFRATIRPERSTTHGNLTGSAVRPENYVPDL